MQKKVTRTFLRTEQGMSEYMRISEERRIKGEKVNIFSEWEKSLIKEFKHWVIIKNEFPYDAIAKTSHMLSTKREVAFDWNLLNEEEIKEFNELKNNYIKENYEVLWENLPKGQTQPGHFHLHLLVLKREEL
jgi:hypothetical protein